MTDNPKSARTALAIKQRLTPAERSAADPKSLRLAIDAFCHDCKDDGSNRPHIVKARVRECTEKGCRLWLVRGWQTTTTRKTSKPPLQTGKSNA